MKKKNCLFLGYDEDKTKLIDFIKDKNIEVRKIYNQELKVKDVIDVDLIISFGYRKIIKNNILARIKKPIINLHMSYLPYNRGSHPNFWSFIDKTPKGVTIHEISNGIDAGDIIFQRQYEFNISLEKFSTFKKTYIFLFKALENLFIENFEKIINYSYSRKKQGNFYTIHRAIDLPKDLTNWNTNIQVYLKKNNK